MVSIPKQVYIGLPAGADRVRHIIHFENTQYSPLSQTTALIVLIINVITPGLGTILSAFLGAECKNETVLVGIAQLLTTPLLGLGFIWAMIWSIRLYRNASCQVNGQTRDEETPLVISEPVVEVASEPTP